MIHKTHTLEAAPCGCECGHRTRCRVMRFREQDRDTLEALGWITAATAPMRVPVPCVRGHEADLVDVIDESEE